MTAWAREFEIAACHGKASFRNQQVASKAARRRHGRCVYRCFVCGAWHVGTIHKRRFVRPGRINGRQVLRW